MDRHYSFDEIDRYAAEREAVPYARELEAHVAICGSCRADLDAALAFLRLLANAETWRAAEGVPDALTDLAARMRREDEDAARALEHHLSSPLPFLWVNIPRRRRLQTGGVVRLLCRESAAFREKDPLHARNLADTAIGVADALPNDYYPARAVYQLRGLAWKERANALRYLNEFDQALEALVRAESAYRNLLVNDLELTSIRFIRATVWWKQQRLNEALTLARQCVAEFADLRDRGRWIDAKLLEGSILIDTHDGHAAVQIFEELHSDADAMGEPMTAARVACNLANAYLEVGNLGSASALLLTALRIFEDFGAATEVARVRWILAYVMLLAGNAAEAESRLRLVGEEFDALNMPADAALVLLDRVEALLVCGRATEVPGLCSELVSRFRAAGMEPAALTAAAFLREAAATRKIVPDDVRHVRRFLRELDANRQLAFAPPPE